MANYILKRPAMDLNRIQKLAKKIIGECSEDRELALSMHRYFKDMVEDNPQDAISKNLMVDCLKLAHSSKVNAIKLMNIMSKLELARERAGTTDNTSATSFRELEALVDE